MTIETAQELRQLKQIGRIVGLALRHVQKAVRPGITTGELDALAAEFLARHGARSAPQLTYAFPGASCISLNDVAAHGIPGTRVVQPGDLVKIDVSAEREGFFADAAITVAVPPVTPEVARLLRCAEEATAAAIATARAGQHLRALGAASERLAKRRGFAIVRELPGHGVGRALHEEPTVPTFDMPRATTRLHDGLVITIEPHVAAGTGRITQEADGWTLRTRDGGWVAMVEHTVVVTRERALLVTAV
jgi:methionyl aminopeptidase